MDNLQDEVRQFLQESRQIFARSLPTEIATAVFQSLANADFSSVMSVSSIQNDVQRILVADRTNGEIIENQSDEWSELYSAFVGAALYLDPEEITAILLGQEE